MKKGFYLLQTWAFSPEAAETGSQWACHVSEQPKTKGAIVVLRKDKETLPLKGTKCYDGEGLFNLTAKVHALYNLTF